MPAWDAYPADYRAAEVRALLTATRAGECVSVLGLSGAGKSNLLGYVAHTQAAPPHTLALVDLNRLPASTPAALLAQVGRALGEDTPPTLEALSALIDRRLATPESSLTLLLDRFDPLAGDPALAANLRALRDAHKYQLAYAVATRRPLPPHTELAELFYANTVWLGALAETDARWTVRRYAARRGLVWGVDVEDRLLAVSARYPSVLRAVCEAHAGGAALDADSLAAHPAVRQRVAEFLADQPTPDELRQAGLAQSPLLAAAPFLAPAPLLAPAASLTPAPSDAARPDNLTAKEARLLDCLQAHPGRVIEKDELIRAIWPEDKVFERGVRDDSLAQLVRRLREKVEPDPAHPRHIHTAPGRGYRYTP